MGRATARVTPVRLFYESNFDPSKKRPRAPFDAQCDPKVGQKAPKSDPKVIQKWSQSPIKRCCRNISIYYVLTTFSGSQAHPFFDIFRLKTDAAHRTPQNYPMNSPFAFFCRIVSILGPRIGAEKLTFPLHVRCPRTSWAPLGPKWPRLLPREP